MMYAQFPSEERVSPRRSGRILSYVYALIIPASVVLLHSQFPEFIGSRFVLIYPALYFIAWMLGTMQAVSALVAYFISLIAFMNVDTSIDWFRVFIFAVTSGFVIWVIDRHKKTVDRLRTNHGLFRTSLESIGDALILTDRDQLIMFMNPVAEKLIGKKLADVRCHKLFSVLNLEGSSIASFGHALNDVMVGKRAWESKGHCRLNSTDGKTHYVEISCAPIRIDEGTMGVVIVLKDVGKVQEALTSLTESEERLRLATDVSGLGIWELNLLTGQVARNSIHDSIFGFSELRSDWAMKDYKERLHSEDLDEVIHLMEHAISSCEPFAHTFRIKREDQTYRWVSATGKVECGIDGKAIRMIGTLIDITEKKSSEDRLHEALFYRDEFLSIASHELKTPLTSLKLQSQMFKRHIEKNENEHFSQERIKRFMSEADTQVSRLTRLVDDMLDISRIRTGRLSISPEKVQISQIVKEVVEKMKPHFSRLEMGEFQDGEVFCDRLRIEQVINNILHNALRYGRGLPVRVDLKQNGDFMTISVTDQGIGIPESFREKIFSRFQRAVPASEVSGLGLGLYISKQIIEAHQGRISVDSELDKGSCFTVHIPKNEVLLQ